MTNRLSRSTHAVLIVAAFIAALFGVSSPAAADPDPDAPELLLTEMVVTPTDGEFVEIHNPTDAAIDLTDVYFTDATFANGGTYYYKIVTGADAGGGGFADFHARFPSGASIDPGAYQTIALNGSDAFSTTYGVEPTYELYEDAETADAIPDMVEALSGSINDQGGLTNSGEVAVLYYWDGESDLVTDLDYAVWGDKAEAVDKTGVSIDGPDADSTESTYLDDTAIPSQDPVDSGAHAFGNSWQRDDLDEGDETTTGGNGVGGDDETSEDLSTTWCQNVPTPNAEGNCGTVPTGQCGDPATLISAVQGAGLSSPLVGEQVVIEGVVVGDFQDNGSADSGDLGGFFVQEEDADADGNAMTSEGVFVADGGFGVDVAAGDRVRVNGFVSESYDRTQMGSLSDVLICDSGHVFTPTNVTLPVDAIDDLEAYEGMSIVMTQTLYISEFYNFDRYGEIVLTTQRQFQPTAIHDPGTAAAAELLEENELNRIQLDDGRTSQNPDPARHPNGMPFDLTNRFRGGDTVQNVTGVMDYGFGAYQIQPTTGADYTAVNERPEAPDVGGTIKAASFNVLNYFTTLDMGEDRCGPDGAQECRGADNAEEFERQKAKIVEAMCAIDADVFGLMELENPIPANDPDPDDGIDNYVLKDLVEGLNAAESSCPDKSYAFTDSGTIGEDEPIRQGIIYKASTVSPVGRAVLDDDDFTDPNNLGEEKNRPAIAETFEDRNGGRFTVVVNHLKSKGSPCGPGDDDFYAGNCDLTRTLAAYELTDWLETNPTGVDEDDVLILGDLNAYDKEDPIDVLKFAGYTDLVFQHGGEYAYSYVFDGQLGYLDYGLANPDLLPQVTGTEVWHINADEPDILDYDTSYKKPAQDALYEENAYRSSDHDPVLVGLNLTRDVFRVYLPLTAR